MVIPGVAVLGDVELVGNRGFRGANSIMSLFPIEQNLDARSVRHARRPFLVGRRCAFSAHQPRRFEMHPAQAPSLDGRVVPLRSYCDQGSCVVRPPGDLCRKSSPRWGANAPNVTAGPTATAAVSRGAERRSAERVDNGKAIDHLPVGQVFGVDPVATEGQRGGDDCAIPK